MALNGFRLRWITVDAALAMDFDINCSKSSNIKNRAKDTHSLFIQWLYSSRRDSNGLRMHAKHLSHLSIDTNTPFTCSLRVSILKINYSSSNQTCKLHQYTLSAWLCTPPFPPPQPSRISSLFLSSCCRAKVFSISLEFIVDFVSFRCVRAVPSHSFITYTPYNRNQQMCVKWQ